MSKWKYDNAAAAASFHVCHTGKGRYPVPFRVITAALRPGAPIPPATVPPAKIDIPVSRLSQTAQTRHRQINFVCDIISLMISSYYIFMAQWHRQNLTYRARRRTRARVNFLILLIYNFNYLKNCLCHCAYSILTGLCVCSTRMCPVCAIVPNGGRYAF